MPLPRIPAPLLLAVLAAALLAPVALAPPPLNDSHWINLVWSDQFTALIRDGIAWPRWLPWSHDGLGAPVFYFYGPVAFWVAGVLGLVGLDTWPALLGTAWVALALSGIAMHAFLRETGTRYPLAAAAFYLAAPYHLLDFARRGALAEFCAIALLPLIAIGVRHAIAGRPGWLAAAYAALIMTHLPSALLASAFLLPMLCGMGRATRAALLRVGAGLAIGIGLAAAYLVPAIALQPFTAMETMRAAGLLLPSAWTPATYWHGGVPALLVLGAIGALAAVIGGVLCAAGRDPWGLFTVGVAALALGAMPMLWLVPPLDRVQFPWRVLPLAEFGLAMLIARSALSGPRLMLAGALPLILSAMMLIPSLTAIGSDGSPTRARMEALLERHPDVIEYLPRGAGERQGARSEWALALAARTPPERYAGGTTTVRRFAFPIWQVRCGGDVAWATTSPEGLLAYAGRGCVVERHMTWPERIGWAVTLAALAGMLALAARARARMRAPSIASNGNAGFAA